MSFILDALRKSENERQREAAPSLSRAPLASARHQIPVWTWLVIGILTLALIALTTAVWQSGPPEITSISESVPESLPTPTPAATVSESSEAAPSLVEESRPATLTSLTTRPIREIATLDPSLPRFRLELLAYNGRDPSGSSAWINGQRYFVGDQVAGGPELVEVRPDGVVLLYREQQFLLTTR